MFLEKIQKMIRLPVKKKNTPYIVTEQAEVYELYQFYDKHNLLLIKLAENKNFVLFL